MGFTPGLHSEHLFGEPCVGSMVPPIIPKSSLIALLLRPSQAPCLLVPLLPRGLRGSKAARLLTIDTSASRISWLAPSTASLKPSLSLSLLSPYLPPVEIKGMECLGQRGGAGVHRGP